MQSAFKEELDRTTRVAEGANSVSKDAERRVDELERRFRTWGLVGVIGGAVAVAGLVISAYSLTFPVMEKVHGQGNRIGELEKSVEEILEGGATESVVAPGEDAGMTAEPIDEVEPEAGESVQSEPPKSGLDGSASLEQGE